MGNIRAAAVVGREETMDPCRPPCRLLLQEAGLQSSRERCHHEGGLLFGGSAQTGLLCSCSFPVTRL